MTGFCRARDRCGPTGKECRADDRGCQSEAIGLGLEIVCDRSENDVSIYVYCPQGSEARDSSVVWLLLVVAVAIAVVGGAVFARYLRRE